MRDRAFEELSLAMASYRPVNRPFLVLVLLAAGCGTREKIGTAVLAEGCLLNSDCDPKFVCLFRRCHQPCDKQSDCQLGPDGKHLNCVDVERPYKACLLPQDSRCLYNTDCGSPLVCAADLRCHAECLDVRDCVSGQVCAAGTCAAEGEVNDAGKLTPGVDDGGTPGAPRCAYNSDCAVPLFCKGGSCVPECRSMRDCQAGQNCEGGSCVLPNLMTDGGSGSGNGCLLNSDCPPGELCGLDNRCRYECLEARDCSPGACCYQRSCRRGAACNLQIDGGVFDAGSNDGGSDCQNDLGCVDTNFCNGIKLCVNNRCQAPAHPICDDSNPCTIDMCDAIAKTCSYASISVDAGDDDHDGHKAVQCGGSSDDCDDNNPNVFFGHPEDCDFVDNNCNGAIDEGLWRERPGSRISLHGSARYPYWAGKPGVARVDGGFVAVVASDTIDGALEAFRLTDSLSLIQGPVQIFKSSTQWVNPPGLPNVYGRRMLRPTVQVNPSGELLMSAWVGDAQGVTACPPSSMWTLHTPVFRTDGLLTAPRQWEDLDTESVSAFCPTSIAPEQYYPRVTSARIAWSPAASRWIAMWGTNAVSTPVHELTAAYFDSDGGVTNRHDLLQMPDPNLYFTPYYNGVPPPFLAPGPTNVFVAFDSQASNDPSWVLMDPSLNSRVSPVRELFEVGSRITAVGLAPQGYFMVSRFGATTSMRFFSTDGGSQLGGRWTLESYQGPTGSPPRGFDGTEELAIAPLQDGFVYIENKWPNASFGFISSKNDGGIVSTSLPMASTLRSGFTVVPIDDRTVGVMWTDGELKRTLMECAP